MGRRSRGKTKRQKTVGYIGREELISKLPDDILIHILSLLAPQEVIRCGVLSRRWTSLPKLVPMPLKFFWNEESLLDETEFTHQVNHVLDSYPGETLSELSICFQFGKLDQRSQFDKWVQFAMAKNVCKFSLNLSGFMGGYASPKYRFPPIRSYDIGLPRWCNSLTDIQLECLKVTNKQIKHFLKCCPFLESLCVIRSNRLTSLKVDGHIRLKFLDIQDCDNLQDFEISTPNLVSLKYVQYHMKIMPLKWAPQLNELLVSANGFLKDNIHLFTSYFDHIVTLSLVVQDPVANSNQPEFRWPTQIPTLRNLKNLTIHYERFNCGCLLSFCSWIEASPVLKRFVFEKKGCVFRTLGEVVKPKMCPRQFLKEFEFIGYESSILDSELVEYIIENAVNLDKMVIDCRRPVFVGTPYEYARKSSDARLCASEFKSKLSPTVKFVVI